MTPRDFLRVVQKVYGSGPLPKPLHLVAALDELSRGGSPAQIAKAFKTTKNVLVQASEAASPLEALMGLQFSELSEISIKRSRKALGQLLIGRAAEIAFEDLYRSQSIASEYDLRDHRSKRSGTDYRVHDRSGRPLYRLNIKFHGSRFRRSPELVGLVPDDCFALATYKIKNALDKQNDEHLPYIFAVVGVFDLSGDKVAATLPVEVIECVASVSQASRMSGVRDVEDQVIQYLVSHKHKSFLAAFDSLRNADWYVLSARKAFLVMQEKLFDRVYALRVRGFAQQFRGAELDMHFSLSKDLTPISTFFDTLQREGETKMASLLERGSL